jgi:hypothetical protein
MWRTERGERILKGAETEVFAEALSSLLDFIVTSISGLRIYLVFSKSCSTL